MELRPLRKSVQPVLFQTIQGRSLTRSADDVILSHARILGEGTVEKNAGDGGVFHGSLLVTIDLARLRVVTGEETLSGEMLAECLRKSLMFRMKLLRLARIETEQRCAPALLREMKTELEFKIEPERLLIDIDIIGPLAAADAGLERATEENPR